MVRKRISKKPSFQIKKSQPQTEQQPIWESQHQIPKQKNNNLSLRSVQKHTNPTKKNTHITSPISSSNDSSSKETLPKPKPSSASG